MWRNCPREYSNLRQMGLVAGRRWGVGAPVAWVGSEGAAVGVAAVV